MPFYLTTLVNAPKAGETKRLKPLGWEQTSAYSVLKLDLVKVIVWSKDDINLPGVTLVADDKDETIGAAVRTAVGNLRGDSRQLPNRFGDVLGELLRFPPNARWNALRSMNDGVFRVKMGLDTIWSAPDPLGARRHSKQAVDTFDRSNRDLNGDTSSDGKFTWADVVGGGWSITSNRASVATGGSGRHSIQSSFVLDTDDMEIFYELISSTLITVGVAGRGDGEFHAGGGYTGEFDNRSSPNTGTIYDLQDGAEVSHADVGSVTGSIRLLLNGSVQELYQDGTLLTSGSDATQSGVNRASLYSYSIDASAVASLDNFILQDIGFTNVPTKRPQGLNLLKQTEDEDDGHFNDLDIKNWYRMLLT